MMPLALSFDVRLGSAVLAAMPEAKDEDRIAFDFGARS
jgi:hypothetical protein